MSPPHTPSCPTTNITIIITTGHYHSSSTIRLRLDNEVTASILHLAAPLPDEWSGREVSRFLGLSPNKMTPLPVPTPPAPGLLQPDPALPPLARSNPLFRLHPPHYPLNTLIIPLLIRAAQQIGGCIRGRQCAGAYGIISY